MAVAALTPLTAELLPQRKFTVAEYHKLIEIGMVTRADRCELIHGMIVEKPPINPPYAAVVRRLTRRLTGMLAANGPQVQLPITFADSEPEPDLAVVAPSADDYGHAHPGPADTYHVIEVSDSRLDYDQRTKLRLYAAAKIPVYWIVNLQDQRVEVYTDPRGGKSPAYRTRTDYAPGESVPVTVAGKVVGSIPVSELLP